MTEWILEKKGDSLLVYETGKGEDVAEVLGTEADGRLIAAAPALAQALREAAGWLDVAQSVTEGHNHKMLSSALGAAHEALALLDGPD